ncbi:MAG: hypothetical protein V1851_02305 [Patescibacteria group bacterium]
MNEEHNKEVLELSAKEITEFEGLIQNVNILDFEILRRYSDLWMEATIEDVEVEVPLKVRLFEIIRKYRPHIAKYARDSFREGVDKTTGIL